MKPVVVRLARDLPCGIPEAFAWLTDYSEDDPQRAGAFLASRRIVARAGNRVRMEGEHVAFGRRIPSTYEVELSPPDAWVSRVLAGPRLGSVTTYRLEPTPRGCRLHVEYRMLHEERLGRFVLRVGKTAVRRRLVRMWEGYERALAADLGQRKR